MHLVREGTRHHERRVPGGATQVEQAPGRKHDDAVSIREDEAVHLRLDVLHLHALHLLKARHVNLIVEVADVPDDCVVLHLLHVLQGDDVKVPRGGGEDVDLAHDRLQSDHLETLHARLQGADRVYLCDQDTGTGTTHGEGAALADIAIAAHKRTLATDHHVCRTHNAIGERMTTTVHIVELRLRDAVIHVDGREKELALRRHLLQPVHARGRLLADTPH